ncbi:MAG: 30S ribosomal protein S10 [Mycoplasmataceae bacterium]|nr:MAG: 30S ribosomal protein S10 [Mycoplasmataceae bacterium]
MEKNNQINITVCGYDVATIDEASKMVSDKVSQLKLKFKIVPLPTKTKRATVLISPHKHKDSQETFVQRIHRRLIKVISVSPSDLEALEKLKVPNTAHLQVKTFF